MPAKPKMSQSDKHAIVMLAECHRRDGHKDFIARTSRELSVPNHIISHLLKRYKDGELDMTSEVVTQFSTEEWAQSKGVFKPLAAHPVYGRGHPIYAYRTSDQCPDRDAPKGFGARGDNNCLKGLTYRTRHTILKRSHTTRLNHHTKESISCHHTRISGPS